MTAACFLIGGLVFVVVLLFTGCSDKTSYTGPTSYTESEREEYNKAVANYYRALAELYESDNK